MRSFSIVVHGGAGSLPEAGLDTGLADAARAGLHAALDAGASVLAGGGSALDAVVTAVSELENCQSFNAGRGAVLDVAGQHSLEAAVMNGATREAGAVSGVSRVANPVLLARRVMERTPHVMLRGNGAEAFAEAEGLELMPDAYFRTAERVAQYRRLGKPDSGPAHLDENHLGTVGACAADSENRLAAATSTGGLSNQMRGRVGDSPIIGAGTWADRTCAVSATGIGEYFVRSAAAARVAAWMEIGGASLGEAVRKVLFDEVVTLGGTGGLIAVDRNGAISMQHSTALMYRGSIDRNGNRVVAITGAPPGDS